MSFMNSSGETSATGMNEIARDWLAELMASYREELTPLAITTYRRALEDLSDSDRLRAAENTIRFHTGGRLPPPGQVREYLTYSRATGAPITEADLDAAECPMCEGMGMRPVVLSERKGPVMRCTHRLTDIEKAEMMRRIRAEMEATL